MIQGLPDLLGEVLGCVEAELDPAPGRVLIAPGGEVAWDACCDGQLWVRVVSAADVSAELGARPGADGSCAVVGWGVTVGVGVLRCTPSVDARGHSPAAGDVTGSAVQVLADMAAVARGLLCCAPVTRPRSLAWVPLGPEGGCAGGEWTFDVWLPVCGCVDRGL